jgi:hypothetical protein
MENNLIEQNSKALCISGVVRSIFKEMKFDEKTLDLSDRNTKQFKEGYKEAIRNLAIIIKQETEIDVRK